METLEEQEMEEKKSIHWDPKERKEEKERGEGERKGKKRVKD